MTTAIEITESVLHTVRDFLVPYDFRDMITLKVNLRGEYFVFAGKNDVTEKYSVTRGTYGIPIVKRKQNETTLLPSYRHS